MAGQERPLAPPSALAVVALLAWGLVVTGAYFVFGADYFAEKLGTFGRFFLALLGGGR